jgi:hypothetical protein
MNLISPDIAQPTFSLADVPRHHCVELHHMPSSMISATFVQNVAN